MLDQEIRTVSYVGDQARSMHSGCIFFWDIRLDQYTVSYVGDQAQSIHSNCILCERSCSINKLALYRMWEIRPDQEIRTVSYVGDQARSIQWHCIL